MPQTPTGDFAGQHRADRHRVDAGPFDLVDRVLVDQGSGRQHQLAAQRVEDIDCRGAAENAVGERRDDLAALHHGARRQPAGGAAILLGDDRVLRDVDEAAGQIAGIGGLQRRVGEPLAGAVRRVEIFEDSPTAGYPRTTCSASGAPGSAKFLAILDEGRIAIARVGGRDDQACLIEHAVRYAQDRHVFGRPIGRNQAVAFKCADLAVLCDTARLLGPTGRPG